MHWSSLRRVLVLGAAVATAGFAAPVSAQSSASSPAASARPTASATSPADAPETARRRPMRRSAARPDSVFTVSSAGRAASSSSASAAAAHSAMVAMTVRDGSQSWLGTPYRWGGTTRRGVDCSAFVRAVMQDQFAISLPRTTAGQQFEGVPVSRAELSPGDLVFFRRTGVRHVGIYLGDGEFVHASSSRGVIVSTMDSGYWDDQYWMARRVLDAPASGRRPQPRTHLRRLLDAADSVRVRG